MVELGLRACSMMIRDCRCVSLLELTSGAWHVVHGTAMLTFVYLVLGVHWVISFSLSLVVICVCCLRDLKSMPQNIEEGQVVPIKVAHFTRELY